MPASFNFDQLPSRLNTRSVKWDEADPDVLPLWVADMDFPTAPCVQQAVVRRAMHPCYGYTLVPEDYYQAIIQWFWERHGWRIHRSEILYTIGVVPAIAAILRAVCQTGDRVVMLTPVYNCFYSSIRNAGAMASLSSLVPVAQGSTLSYKIDWDDLEQRLADERATVLLLCNPHNPVGRIWTREELGRIATLCVKHHVMVISDEIHCELTAPGSRYVPFATALTAEHADLALAVCTSPSKAFNIAGLQNANIIVRDSELRRRIDRAINLNETCDVNPFGVEAVIAAYREGEAWLDELCRYVWGNYDFARELINKECPALRVTDLQATYLMWVDYSAMTTLPSDLLHQRLIDEARVWFTEGLAYGEEGRHCLRINLATSRQILTEALTRFITWLKTNS